MSNQSGIFLITLYNDYMQEHPIPRQITSFEFKLIGELTIKQFGYLIFAAVFAVILYFLAPKILFLNFVFAAIPVAIGAGFAFVPINERPMDVAVKNLVRRLTSPTQYYYKKNNPPPRILLGMVVPPRDVVEQHMQAQKKLNEYMQSKPRSTPVENGLTVSESVEQKTKNIQAILGGSSSKIRHSFEPAAPVAPASTAPTTPPVVAPIPTDNPIPAAPISATITPQVDSVHSEVIQAQSSPGASDPISVTALPSAPEEERFTFKGAVVSPNGVPLPGLLVYVKKGAETVRLFKTDTQGMFSNTMPLKKDTYTLEVDDPQKKYAFDRMIIDGSKSDFELFAQKA